MGIVDSYMHNRRKKKLEEINKALEKLKREHPFDPTSFKPKIQQPTMAAQTNNSKIAWILAILFLIIAIITTSMLFYYKGQLTTIEEGYEEKETELQTLQTTLQTKIAELEKTKTSLKDKTALGLNLSDESYALRKQKQNLEEEIIKLKQQIFNKEVDLSSLNKTNTKQKNEIKEWITCIEDKFKEDPDDCDI